MRTAIFAAIGLLIAQSTTAATLQIVARISLAGGKGRIDHLAFDSEHRRLFVAERGNDTVAVVDVDQRRFERRLGGFHEPQGIAFDAPLQRLFVANGVDGFVHAFDTRDFKLLKIIPLASDADNVRIDSAGRVYVGYGNGGLAVLNSSSLEKVGDIRLKAHPEAFQLAGDRIYVNVPGQEEVAVVDRSSSKQVGSWPATRWSANYPMAIEEDAGSVLVVFREPARIARYSIQGGSISADAEVCGDADDVFIDAKRQRVYVICGEGVVDVLDRATLKKIDAIPTSPGARTGLYSTEADALFVAVRAGDGREAAVWVLKPN